MNGATFGRNLAHFARALRRGGLAVGPDRLLSGIAALQAVGVHRRDDVHAALSAVMLDRHEQQPLFDAVFDAYWRDPLRPAAAPQAGDRGEPARPRPSRLDDALAARRAAAPQRDASPPTDAPRPDVTPSASGRERLQRADFEAMTADEFAQAKVLAEAAPLPVRPVRRRRQQAAPRGAIDLRRTLRRMAHEPQLLLPAYRRARCETPPLVVLLDISGSMDRYARLFLHYVHGLLRRRLRVHAFTIGTRLTNITRCLRERDADDALRRTDALVPDWRGGTRIAGCLHEFNQRWARRVLGGNAALLLVSDGLDHGDPGELGRAAALLHRLAHEVVWLNPLLRFDGFEPRASGVRALLPHVDRLLPVHNLASLADLARSLGTAARIGPGGWPR